MNVRKKRQQGDKPIGVTTVTKELKVVVVLHMDSLIYCNICTLLYTKVSLF